MTVPNADDLTVRSLAYKDGLQDGYKEGIMATLRFIHSINKSRKPIDEILILDYQGKIREFLKDFV